MENSNELKIEKTENVKDVLSDYHLSALLFTANEMSSIRLLNDTFSLNCSVLQPPHDMNMISFEFKAHSLPKNLDF